MVRRSKKAGTVLLRRGGAMMLAAAMVLGSAAFAVPAAAETGSKYTSNYALLGGSTATASDVESNTSFTAAKAIDGIVNRDAAGQAQSRWSTNKDDAARAVTLTVDLKKERTIGAFEIEWERTNITSFKIAVSSDGTTYTDVCSESNAGGFPVSTRTELGTEAKGQYVRLTVDGYNGGTVNWACVSVYEFRILGEETGEVVEKTAAEVAASLTMPTLTKDTATFELPKVNGFDIELIGADYEQIISNDLKVHQPLTDTDVKVSFKVTRTSDNTTAKSGEYTVKVPGKATTNTGNAKPAVIPEMAEWLGAESGDFTLADTSRIVVNNANKDALTFMADEMKADLKDVTGKDLTVVYGSASDVKAGDLWFTLTGEDKGLDKEGYIMNVSDKVEVTAEDPVGAYWSTRTILQILKQTGGTIAKGEARDYPKYEVRGFMLDVGRKPVSLEMVKAIVKDMAWYKMSDFQLHLNDNYIFLEKYDSDDEALAAYSGFRLESDIKEGGDGGKNKQDLTSKDMAYTKAEFRDLIQTSRKMGVNIVPEFDTPGHALAFMQVRPDLRLKNVVSGQAKRRNEQFDLAAGESYNATLDFIKGVWNEYLTGADPVFDAQTTVNVGTDEYYGEKDRFRVFTNDITAFIKATGRDVRLWGSLSQMQGSTKVDGTGIQVNIWNTGWANPQDMYRDNFGLINMVDKYLYIVPAAGYYKDYLDAQYLYNSWTPNNFDGTVIPAGSDQMLGSAYAIWNDSIDKASNGISEADIYDRFIKALPSYASKVWGDGSDRNYSEMTAVAAKLGDAPNNNPTYKATAAEGAYAKYEFTKDNEQKDTSGTGRDIVKLENAQAADGSLTLAGGKSYAETSLSKLATGSSLSFDITLDKPAKAGQILFESDAEYYTHDIRIMADGSLGYTRELYDYYFDYKLPVGEKTHIEIKTDGTKTSLYVNGSFVSDAKGKYVHNGQEKASNIAIATLLLPVQRIGSAQNAVSAVIDNVVLATADSSAGYDKTKWTGTTNSETLSGETKGGHLTHAFDGDDATIWHSNWNGATDKLTGSNSFYAEIDLGAAYPINQFSFTPRQDANSGFVTKADLFVKTNEGDEWTQVAQDQTFDANKSKKTFTFDEKEVRYVKFVAKDSNDGWVAVSEFDIGNVPVQTYKVYVEAGEGGTVSGGTSGVAAGESVTVKAVESAGYVFAGWFDAATDKKVSDEKEYTFSVESNVALRAEFTKQEEVKTYTVTIDGTEYSVREGEKLDMSQISTPEKAGHRFDGYVDAATQAAADLTAAVTKDMNVVSKFTPYVVEAQSDANGTVTVSDMNDKGRVTVKAEAKSGYEFKGWKKGSEVVSTESSYTFIPTEDTTLVPVFEKLTVVYTVTVDGTKYTVEEGKKLDASQLKTPEKAGHRFDGYVDAATGADADLTAAVTKDMNVVSKFTAYTVKAQSDANGTATVSDMNDKGQVTVKAEAKSGYEFKGWKKGSEVVSTESSYTFIPTEDVTLVPVFEKQTVVYTVTVDGTKYTVEEGKKLDASQLKTPEKAGHRFDGYVDAATGEKADLTAAVTKDMNVVSKFTAYEVEAQKADGGSVTVSDMDSKGQVTVKAETKAGYVFKGWKLGNAIVSTDAEYTFVPSGDVQLVPVFEEEAAETFYTVTVDGKVQSVKAGESVTVKAETKEGFVFKGWASGETIVSTEKEYTFTPDRDIALVSVYEKEEPTDPKDPTKPEDPKDPTKPEDPKDPTKPEDPKDPTKPEDPKDPTKPEVPTEPVKPVEKPEKPTAPTTGDEANMMWLMMTALIGGMLIVTVRRGKKADR